MGKKKKAPLPKWAKTTIRISRWIAVPTLCILAVFFGMIVGYVTIGDQPFSEIFKLETWKHPFDLVFKDEVDT